MSRIVMTLTVAMAMTLATSPRGQAADLNPSGQVSEVSGNDLVDLGEDIAGQVWFARVAQRHAVHIRWVDTKGRLCGRIEATVETPNTTLPYRFNSASAIGHNHRIEVLVDGKLAPVSLGFTVRRPYTPWVDYKACVWAHYTAGEAALVRQAGFNGAINASRNVTDADLAFYPDNIVYEVFAYYHKRPVEFQAMKEAWFANPSNRALAHRRPSLTDEGTWAMVRDRLLPVVKQAAPFRPIFYNVADEIGIGDQSAVTDLDWEYSSRDAWRDWLQARYGTLEAVNRQWGAKHESWSAVRAFFPATNFMYDQLWAENLLPKAFGTIDAFNAQLGVKYESFADVTAGYANVRGDDKGMTAAGLEQRYRTPDALGKDLGHKFADFAAAAAYLSKFEKWAAQQTAADTRGWNLSWWCDWREYMDDYMANGLGRACELGRKADPGGRFGITGTHHPGVFNGHNYGKLVDKIDAIIPYNIGQSFELIRGLRPDLPFMNPTWATGEKLQRDLWYHFLHGCRGVLAWDNQEPDNKMIDRATGTLTARGQAAAPVLHEITSGTDRLFLEGRREHSGIAIYHSQMSARVNWFHQFVGLGRRYMLRGSGSEYRQDERSVLRTSWLKLIEDNHMQCIFVTPEQVAAGRLAQEGVKVLVLPETWAMSDDEARHIEAFVRAGGTVVADQYTGLYDGHGRRRAGGGVLDGLFGIDQSAVSGDIRTAGKIATAPATQPAMKIGPHIAKLLADAAPEGAAAASWDALSTRGPNVHGVRMVAEDAIIWVGEKSDAALIVRELGPRAAHEPGSGGAPGVLNRTVFLNLDVSHYSHLRTGDLPKAEQVLAAVRYGLGDLVEYPGGMPAGGGSMPVRVSSGSLAIVPNAATKRRQPGTEVGVWSAGPGRRTLAVWRNYNINTEGIGGEAFADNALFEKPEKVRIQLPTKQYAINQRTGEELGQTQIPTATDTSTASVPWRWGVRETDTVEVELSPWEPVILSLSDKPFGAFKVSGPAEAKCGQAIALQIEGAPLKDTLQVFRVEAVNPAGEAVWYYAQTLSTRAGRCRYQIPLALNDWTGAWTFKVRDVATGKVVEHKVKIDQ